MLSATIQYFPSIYRKNLVFSICTGIIKKQLKRTRNKKKTHNKIVILFRSKLNSIGSKISQAIINNENINEDFMTIINEENKYRELKIIKMINSQMSGVEKINLIEEDKIY